MNDCWSVFDHVGVHDASVNVTEIFQARQKTCHLPIFTLKKKMPNAGVHQPKPRRDDGQPTVNNPQPVMREKYAETHARGFGLRATLC